MYTQDDMRNKSTEAQDPVCSPFSSLFGALKEKKGIPGNVAHPSRKLMRHKLRNEADSTISIDQSLSTTASFGNLGDLGTPELTDDESITECDAKPTNPLPYPNNEKQPEDEQKASPKVTGVAPQIPVKLFINRIPRWMCCYEVNSIFSEFGRVLECNILRGSNGSKGCAFIKYASITDAYAAIVALHGKRVLNEESGPVQVKYADGEIERLGLSADVQPGGEAVKVFVGSLPKACTEKDLFELFSQFGSVNEVFMITDCKKQSKCSAFITFPKMRMALASINALDKQFRMPPGKRVLEVRLAESKWKRKHTGTHRQKNTHTHTAATRNRPSRTKAVDTEQGSIPVPLAEHYVEPAMQTEWSPCEACTRMSSGTPLSNSAPTDSGFKSSPMLMLPSNASGLMLFSSHESREGRGGNVSDGSMESPYTSLGVRHQLLGYPLLNEGISMHEVEHPQSFFSNISGYPYESGVGGGVMPNEYPYCCCHPPHSRVPGLQNPSLFPPPSHPHWKSPCPPHACGGDWESKYSPSIRHGTPYISTYSHALPMPCPPHKVAPPPSKFEDSNLAPAVASFGGANSLPNSSNLIFFSEGITRKQEVCPPLPLQTPHVRRSNVIQFTRENFPRSPEYQYEISPSVLENKFGNAKANDNLLQFLDRQAAN